MKKILMQPSEQLREQLADTIEASNEVTDENIDLERQLAAAEAWIKEARHYHRDWPDDLKNGYSDTTALDAAIAEAVKGVSVIRCIKHINVPQINTTEITGAECGVCAFDKGAAAAQKPLVDALHRLAMRVLQSDFYLQAKQETDNALLLAKVKEGK